MYTNFIKTKKPFRLLIIFLLVGIINSCHKEKNQQKLSGSKLSQFPELQAIFEQGAKNSKSEKVSYSTGAKLNFIKSIDVNWDSYFIQKRRDSSTVVEFDIKNDPILFSFRKTYLGDSLAYRSKTTVAFIKFKDGSRLNFFIKVIEDISSKGQTSRINDVHYNQIPKHFRGTILFYTLDKQFMNGYSYMFGKQMGKVSIDSYQSPNAIPRLNNQSLGLHALQTCITYPVYQTYCESVTANGTTYDHGCTETYVGTTTICQTTDDSGSGTTPTAGGSGGVAGDTGATNPNNCPPASGSGSQLVSGLRQKVNVTQPNPGGTPPPSTDCPTLSPVGLADQLGDELNKNPSMLLPCAEVAKFLSLVNQKPPQAVYDRINRLNDNTASKPLFSNPYFVQQIKNALGPQINLDRFEIKVSKLPTVNGAAMNASQFLKYVRLNLNSFVDNDVATFQPYVDPSNQVNDSKLWNSDNPIGAILHLHMLDNGSVITEESASDHWTVATLRTPLDEAHPVSGNRSWGYVANSDGSYTFYVTGADRLTTGIHELAQYVLGLPFNGADKLWTSYQTKLAAFVNSHGGMAAVGGQTKDRPDYYLLSLYFNGKITLAQLKAVRGCN